MPDLTRPLQECLEAMDEKRNLQDVLRRHPADRNELIALLRLSVDLGGLGAPTADPAFRLRARNRMLASVAARHRRRRWNLRIALPRPVSRLALAGVSLAALMLASLTAAAASGDSLPGDPLYAIKLGRRPSSTIARSSCKSAPTFGSTKPNVYLRWAGPRTGSA